MIGIGAVGLRPVGVKYEDGGTPPPVTANPHNPLGHPLKGAFGGPIG